MQSEWPAFWKELSMALGAIAGMMLAAVIAGYFISLPHHGSWVDAWARYTLMLMVGIPIVGCGIGSFIREEITHKQEGPWPALVSMVTWIFWALCVALLIGFLISQPHTGNWLEECGWIFIAAILAIVILVLTGLGQDELDSPR